MIKYAGMISDSVVDGTGIRLVTFLQGCPRHCPGCHNPELIPQNNGREIEAKDFARMILKRITPQHSGITFSGGDPLMQADALYDVLTRIRKKRPDLSIWVYTGYNFEEVKDLPVMNLIDVLVDGPFIEQQKDLGLAFRGSSNQRIIDVPKSLLKRGNVIELNLDGGRSIR
jgi:anaerobic ribonucleoside-triphosphate reductase activating protein